MMVSAMTARSTPDGPSLYSSPCHHNTVGDREAARESRVDSVALERVRKLGVLGAVLEQEDVTGLAVHGDRVFAVGGRHFIVVAPHATRKIVVPDVVRVSLPVGVHGRENALSVCLCSQLRTAVDQVGSTCAAISGCSVL